VADENRLGTNHSETKDARMDTDDLTPMAYETLSRAFEFCDALRAEIGASASEFRTEDDFLRGTRRFLNEILADPEDYLDFWNLVDDTDVKAFVRGVKSVRGHVTTTLKTPRDQRGKPPFEKDTT